MTIQEMFDAALAVVKEHNSVIGEGNPGYLNPDKFLPCIKAAGGTTVDRLKSLSYEDILACMPNNMVTDGHDGVTVKPIAIAKDIAKIFRGKETVTNVVTDSEKRPVSAKKAEKMTLLELVQNYDPEDDNAVSKRLKEISRNETFVVFSSGRTVDITTTLKLLQEVKQGFDGRSNVVVNGEPQEVYRVGGLPDNFVEENPIYRNRPLRPDGTCDQTGRSWNGVGMNIRQLIALAINNNELTVTIENAHNVLDMVMGTHPWTKLISRYPKAAVEYKKLEKMAKLPTLQLVLNKDRGGSEGKNPFHQGRR